MTRLVPVQDSPSLEEGARAVREIDGTSVLFLREQGVVYAIENRCPHRGAPLSGAVLKDGCLHCAWHGLRFKLDSGECLTNAEIHLRKLPVEQVDGKLAIEMPQTTAAKVAADVRTALVRYGTTGQVGWFGTIHNVALHRSAQVVVESAIGSQLAEVLLGEEPMRNSDPQQKELRGEIVRNANADDLDSHSLAAQFAAIHFREIEANLRRLDHSAVEVEATLDQQVMVVWLLSAPDAALGPVAVEIATRLGIRQVRFLEHTADEPPTATASRYNKSGSAKDARNEGRSMRGPGLRQKHDFDRVWECPVCKHHERTSGMETTVICPKCVKADPNGRQLFMKLITSPVTAPRRTFEVMSNTPVPVPVVAILGEDTARIPRKQALRTAAIEANDAKEKAAATDPEMPLPPEVADTIQPIAQESPVVEGTNDKFGG